MSAQWRLRHADLDREHVPAWEDELHPGTGNAVTAALQLGEKIPCLGAQVHDEVHAPCSPQLQNKIGGFEPLVQPADRSTNWQMLG